MLLFSGTNLPDCARGRARGSGWARALPVHAPWAGPGAAARGPCGAARSHCQHGCTGSGSRQAGRQAGATHDEVERHRGSCSPAGWWVAGGLQAQKWLVQKKCNAEKCGTGAHWTLSCASPLRRAPARAGRSAGCALVLGTRCCCARRLHRRPCLQPLLPATTSGGASAISHQLLCPAQAGPRLLGRRLRHARKQVPPDDGRQRPQREAHALRGARQAGGWGAQVMQSHASHARGRGSAWMPHAVAARVRPARTSSSTLYTTCSRNT